MIWNTMLCKANFEDTRLTTVSKTSAWTIANMQSPTLKKTKIDAGFYWSSENTCFMFIAICISIKWRSDQINWSWWSTMLNCLLMCSKIFYKYWKSLHFIANEVNYSIHKNRYKKSKERFKFLIIFKYK